MDEQHLIPMANRIAEFFATQPRAQEQVDGVVEHLRMFWAPQMRQNLIAYIEGLAATSLDSDSQPFGGQESAQGVSKDTVLEVHPLVIQAVLQARERLLPDAN